MILDSEKERIMVTAKTTTTTTTTTTTATTLATNPIKPTLISSRMGMVSVRKSFVNSAWMGRASCSIRNLSNLLPSDLETCTHLHVC